MLKLIQNTNILNSNLFFQYYSISSCVPDDTKNKSEWLIYLIFSGGGYQFGYDSYNLAKYEARHFKHEVRRPDGTVLGRYGFEDPNGDLKVTNYISYKDGFQVLHPGVIVQLEPVVNNENVQGNEVRDRSAILDAPEAEAPIVHAVIPHGASHLQNGPNSYGYYLPLL